MSEIKQTRAFSGAQLPAEDEALNMTKNETEIDLIEGDSAETGLSQDPEYLAWFDAKIQAAVKADQDHPEKRVPQSEVWKNYGLES